MHLESRIVVGRRHPIGTRRYRLEVPTTPEAVALGHFATHVDDLAIPGKSPKDPANSKGLKLLNSGLSGTNGWRGFGHKPSINAGSEGKRGSTPKPAAAARSEDILVHAALVALTGGLKGMTSALVAELIPETKKLLERVDAEIAEPSAAPRRGRSPCRAPGLRRCGSDDRGKADPRRRGELLAPKVKRRRSRSASELGSSPPLTE